MSEKEASPKTEQWNITHLYADDKTIKKIDCKQYQYNLKFHPERKMVHKGRGFIRVFYQGHSVDITMKQLELLGFAEKKEDPQS